MDDHASAIDVIFHKGNLGETYNIGGLNEWTNINLVKLLCDTCDELLQNPKGKSQELITYVTDRAGHDMRYAIDASKLVNELAWSPTVNFEQGLKKTVGWYLQNDDWLKHVTSGDYLNYYDQHYANR